jgi:hypothetical protein
VNVEGISWHAIVLEPEPFAATKALMSETFGLAPEVEGEGMIRFIMPNGTMLDLRAPGRPRLRLQRWGHRFWLPGGRPRGSLGRTGGGGVRAARRDHARGGDGVRLPRLPRSRRSGLRPQRAQVGRAHEAGRAGP